jgi:hypothetical protein
MSNGPLKLRNVKWTPYKAANGTTRYHYYYRPTGKLLGTSDDPLSVIEAHQRLELAEARAPQRLHANSIGRLARDFQTSEGFPPAASTQKLWRPYLRLIEERWGALHPSELDRQMVIALRDELIERSRWVARNFFKCASAFWAWALDLGYVTGANLFVRPRIRRERITPENDPLAEVHFEPRKALWSRQDARRFLAAKRQVNVGGQGEETFREEALPDDIRLAFFLGLIVDQRQADVLSITERNLVIRNGRMRIVLRQQKTKKVVSVSVHKELKAELDRRGFAPGGKRFLVSTRSGGRFGKRNFYRKFSTWLKVSGVPSNLDFRALRRSAMDWMSADGADVRDIAAVSGHSIATTQKILDEYLIPTEEAADRAIARFRGINGGDSRERQSAGPVRARRTKSSAGRAGRETESA